MSRLRAHLWVLIPAALSLFCIFLPQLTHAASLTSIIAQGGACNCNGSDASHIAPDFGCVVQVFQILLGDFVAFATLFLTVLIAWAGFTYILNPTNPEKRSQANARLFNAIIGLLIVLAAWLLVDTVMKVVYNDTTGSGSVQFGPWNSILQSNGHDYCIVAHANPSPLTAIGQIANPTNPIGGTVPSTAAGNGAASSTPSSDIPARICNSMNSYIGSDTSAGPGNGRLACAWAVNNILTNAGISSIGSTQVAAMESALQGGRGTSVAQSSAVCGDIVIEAGDGHVGVCKNAGCTQVESNSSSKATFSWQSGIDFAPSYSNGNGRIYRVTN